MLPYVVCLPTVIIAHSGPPVLIGPFQPYVCWSVRAVPKTAGHLLGILNPVFTSRLFQWACTEACCLACSWTSLCKLSDTADMWADYVADTVASKHAGFP
jgi:hypothetical protein